MNSLTPGVLHGIAAAVDAVESTPSLRALVIAGSGRAFSAGADLTGVPDVTSADGGAADFRDYLTEAGKVFARLSACSRPTIAAVHGYALAGGLELALSCDVVVAAESARFGDGHAKYGQFPAGGATARLPLRVGHAYAKYLMFSGAVLTGREAERRGLAEVVTEDGALVETVDRLVESISAASPLGLQRMKEQLEPAFVPLAEHIRAELDVAVEYARSADRAEGLAAFNEGRTPTFSGDTFAADVERTHA
ncbi:enoyl-CoA hydratase [Rhodococcus triatomae BKS 15-14]|nr:enoyl-CoA hydratase [Rhodococcus triatomae BKS 15-14]